MRKEKTIIDKLNTLISKGYKQLEKVMDESHGLEQNLTAIDKVYGSISGDDLSALKSVDESDLKELISLILKSDEEELAKSIYAAHYLAQNDIELVDAQEEKIRELAYRTDIKRRSLKKSIERREQIFSKLDDCNDLEHEVREIAKDGVFSEEVINKVFSVFSIKEEDKGKYLDDFLKFNYNRFLEARRVINKEKDNQIEVLEVPLEVVDAENFKFAEEDLRDLFNKYDFDYSILDENLTSKLMTNGSLDKIEEVLNALSVNRLGFVKKDGRLLTKFLLESSAELIEEGCQLFSDSHVSGEYFSCYKPIFFPTAEEVNGKEYKTERRYIKRSGGDIIDAVPNESNQEFYGKHRDFLRNLELLESFGYNRKDLLERQIAVLLSTNSYLLGHLDELKLYDFPVGQGRFPLTTLLAPRIMEITDGFVELNEEDYILNYSSKLTSYTNGVLDRLYALKKEGMEYENVYKTGRRDFKGFVTNLNLSCGISKDRIKEIVPHDVEKFLEDDPYNMLLDEYLPLTISNDTMADPIIMALEENKRSNWSYNFNGVIISRKKLLRNYEFFMKSDFITPEEREKDREHILLVSAIRGSRLNSEEISKVNDVIMSSVQLGGNKDAVLKR